MFHRARAVLVLIALALVGSCVSRDAPTGVGDGYPPADLQIQPALIPSPADGSALPINRVRAVVTRVPDRAVLADSTYVVEPTDDSWTIDLRVPLFAASTQALVQVLLIHEATDGSRTVEFSGLTDTLVLAAGESAVPATVDLVRGPVGNLFVTGVTVTTPPQTLIEGQTVALAAEVQASSADAAPLAFWTSLDTAVVGVTGASVLALGAGVTGVVASAGAFSDTVSVTVVSAVDSVLVSPGSADVVAGSTVAYAAQTFDGDGNLLTDRTVTWSTGDPIVATVSPTGVVTGETVGETTVRATSEGVFDEATVVVTSPPGGSGTVTWTRGSSGVWSDPTGWDLGRVPHAGDTVRLTEGGDYTVTLDVDASIGRLVIDGDTDVIDLQVEGNALTVTDDVDIGPLGRIAMGTGAISAALIVNEGSVHTFGVATIDGELINEGDMLLEAPTALLRETSGTPVGADHANTGIITISGGGAFALVLGGASPTFTNAGTIEVGAGSTLSVTNVSDDGGLIINDETGVLMGTGTVEFVPGGSLPNPSGINNGTISPGLSPGLLTWLGSVPMGPTGVIAIELEGTTPASGHDVLSVSNALVLDGNGTLEITTPAFTPAPGDRFAVLTFASRSGTFAQVDVPALPGVTLDTVWVDTPAIDTLVIEARSALPVQLNRWVGPTTGSALWSTAANWSTGAVPAAGDSVVIDANGDYTVVLQVDAQVAYLMVGGSSGDQWLLHDFPAVLTVDSAAVVGPTARYILSGGTLTGGGTVTVDGVFQWTQGTMSGPGTTRVTGSALLPGNPTKLLDGGRTFRNASSASWTGGVLRVGGAASFVNEAGATLTIDGGSGVTFGDGGGGVLNQGTITRIGDTGGLSLGTGSVAFVNEGLVDVQTGQVTSNGMATVAHTGDFLVASGATLAFTSGAQTLDGDVTGGGSVILGGSTTVNGVLSAPTVTVFATGTVTLSPTSTVAIADTLRLSAGTLTLDTGSPLVVPNYVHTGNGSLLGTDSVEVTGSFSWDLGEIGNSAFRLAPTVDGAVISGGVAKTLANGVRFRNGTSLVWSAGPFEFSGSSTLINEAGALFDIATLADFSAAGAGGSFENAGVLRKSAGATTVVPPFVTLTNAGTVEVVANMMLDVDGSFTHADGAVLQGAGTLDVSGATILAFDGDVNPGTSPGILNIVGSYAPGAPSTLRAEINGTVVGSGYDQLSVSGAVTLGGDLVVLDTTAFLPQVGDRYALIVAETISGSFATATFPTVPELVFDLITADGASADTLWAELSVQTFLQPTDLCSQYPPSAIASFEDGNLEDAVRAALGISIGDALTCELLGGLTSLSSDLAGIASLVGAQNMTGLISLALTNQAISDIGPLGGLTALVDLDLSGNADIADIQPLLDNVGLGSGDTVDLTGTSADCADVTTLRDRGVNVISPCP